MISSEYSSRSRKLSAAISVVSVLLLVSTGHASTIGVNFAAGSPGQALGSGTLAGVVPQANWQNVLTTSATNLGLTDDSGGTTTAALTFTSDAAGSYNPGAAGGDELLNDTWVANFSPTITINVSSIPYASYDLIVYNLPLSGGASYSYTVGGTTYYGTSPGTGPTSSGYVDANFSTPYTYTRAISTASGSPTANSDYARFTGLTGSSLTYSASASNGVAYINAFQIVSTVPEPGSMVLLTVGALAFGARQLRYRRSKMGTSRFTL